MLFLLKEIFLSTYAQDIFERSIVKNKNWYRLQKLVEAYLLSYKQLGEMKRFSIHYCIK